MKLKKLLFDHKFLFLLTLLICVIFLSYVQFFLNKASDTQDFSSQERIIHLEEFEIYEGNLSTPIEDIDNFETNDTIILKAQFPNDLEYNSALGFFSIHQNVQVYSDNKLIYEYYRNTDDMAFGKTPGYSYNIIPTIYEYQGKEILIYLDSAYAINDNNIPKFVIGDTADIITCEAKNSSSTFLTGLALFLLGFVAIIIWLLFRKNISRGDLTLYYAGIFCVLLSIWTINEQPIVTYYLHNSIITTYISFITLIAFPIALFLLLRELCKTKSRKMWDIILYANYLNVILTILFQIFNIVDFYDSLVANILVFTTSLLITLIYSIYITYKRRTTTEGRVNFICVILICIGYIFYIYKTYTDMIFDLYMGSICIIIYIIVIVHQYIRRSIAVMSKNDQVEFYENLAYKDSLTGLFNRLAYDQAISSVDVNTASYIVVIFDLNNLKFFNDTYGHNIGDTYIKDSSELIQKVFKNLGPVYRIGGDEFCIIMKDKSIFQYETATRELDTLVYNYNRVSEILKINIAYGYALYDSKIDRDIYETRNRADAMMYEKKFFMKKNQVPLI